MVKSQQWWQTSHFKNTKQGIHHLEQQQTEGRQAGKSHSGRSVGKGATVPSNTTMNETKHPLDLAWNKGISWGFKQKPTCFKTKQVEAKPLKPKQVEADHFNQSTRHILCKQSSLPQGANGLSNLQKQTKQQEKDLAIDSGAIGHASAWRKVEKFFKTLPHKPSFWNCVLLWTRGCVHFFLSCSQGQDHKINATTITFFN